MQTAVNDVAAEQVHKDPGTTKEDNRPQDQPAVVDREDHVVLIKIPPLVSRRSERGEQNQRHDRQQGQQVKQYRAAPEKILLDFESEDGANLPPPKRPWQWLLIDCLLRRNVYS